ncbi:MAG: M48 family metalloprotease [Gammaproteobacteria bacterium]
MFRHLLFIFWLIFCHNNLQSQGVANLPSLGDRVSGAVSIEQEKQIGEAFLGQIYAQAPLINDPIVQEFTELLIYRIAESSTLVERSFNVILIDDKTLNAFAAPGGIIGINGGLFLNADDESQFASVISHELAHLSQRHFARNILRGSDTNMASALVMISALALAIVANNPSAFIAGPAALTQENLRYSRNLEKEADRFGFNNLIKAGYDPKSMGEMFENMVQIRRLSGDQIPEFLLTHPISSSRVSDAFNAADQTGIIGGKRNSIDYQFIKGRLKADYYKPINNSYAFFQDFLLEDDSNENIYALVRSYYHANKFKESLSKLEILLKKFPKDIVLQLTNSEILFGMGNLAEAKIQIEEVLRISPKNYPATMLYAKVLSGLNEFYLAEESLRDLLITKKNNPLIWLQLSEIQRASKNILGYHMSLGEYYLILGQTDESLNQFRFALKLSDENFQTTEYILEKIKLLQTNIRNK